MTLTPELLAILILDGQIKGGVFDFDGTVYESRAGVEQQLRPLMVRHTAKVLGCTEADARRLLAHYRGLYRSSVLGLARHHGVDPAQFYDEMYAQLDLSCMEPRVGLADQLLELSSHLPLVIFTNSVRSFLLRAMGILGLDDPSPFAQLITTEDNGYIRKPNEEVYYALYARLGLLPAQIVMFDDIASSLQVLAGHGAHTLLVGNGLRPPPVFFDLHTGEESIGAPEFVHGATHDITAYLTALNHALAANRR